MHELFTSYVIFCVFYCYYDKRPTETSMTKCPLRSCICIMNKQCKNYILVKTEEGAPSMHKKPDRESRSFFGAIYQAKTVQEEG